MEGSHKEEKGGGGRKYKIQDSYERSYKYPKYNHSATGGEYSGYKSRDRLSFLVKKTRY